MKTIIQVPAVAIIVDGGDGGGSTTIYPDLETLKKEHFFEWIDKDSDPEDIAEAEHKYQLALEGNNPYEDGEIDEDAGFEIEYDDETGQAILVGTIGASWGQ